MSASLLKAIKILDSFEKKDEMSINELIEATSLSKTTVFRLANSLEENGLLVKEKKSSHNVVYRLGLKFLIYGRHVKNQMKYNKIAIPYMEDLNKKIDELVHLTVVEDYEAVYVETFHSSKSLKLVINVGERAPLFAGSAPKLLLASFGELEFEKYLAEVELKQRNKNTIRSKIELKDEINAIKYKGFSISRSENFNETIGYSYPIYNDIGDVVAALGVSIPEKHHSKNKETNILISLKTTAVKISEKLGCSQEKYNTKGL